MIDLLDIPRADPDGPRPLAGSLVRVGSAVCLVQEDGIAPVPVYDLQKLPDALPIGYPRTR